MSWVESIYRLVLRLYPEKHRQAFEEAMLLHARDMNRDAENEGSWQVAKLCVSLVKDGIVNGWKEHWEGIMATNEGIRPASWLVVLLAVLPGLLILLTRRMPAQLTPLPLNTWYLYLGTLVIVVPVILWRKKRFPVWALLPLACPDMVVDFLDGYGNGRFGDYAQCPWDAGGNCSAQYFWCSAVITAVVLPDQRLPRSAWVLSGVMIVGNLVLAILYSLEEFGSWDLLFGVIQYFTTSGIVPLEGLMLVAVGITLCAATRRAGDTDRDWRLQAICSRTATTCLVIHNAIGLG